MKLLALSLMIGCQICAFAQPEQLHFSMGIPGTGGNRVELTASSIDRDQSIMRLSGSVEVRMVTCVPGRAGDGHGCAVSMVLHADQVDFNEKTGEIAARGDVRIAPPK